MAAANQPDTRTELAELLKRRNELTVSTVFAMSECFRRETILCTCGVHYLEFICCRKALPTWRGRSTRLRAATWRILWHMAM